MFINNNKWGSVHGAKVVRPYLGKGILIRNG